MLRLIILVMNQYVVLKELFSIVSTSLKRRQVNTGVCMMRCCSNVQYERNLSDIRTRVKDPQNQGSLKIIRWLKLVKIVGMEDFDCLDCEYTSLFLNEFNECLCSCSAKRENKKMLLLF